MACRLIPLELQSQIRVLGGKEAFSDLQAVLTLVLEHGLEKPDGQPVLMARRDGGQATAARPKQRKARDRAELAKEVCTRHLEGRCKFGERCWRKHIEAPLAAAISAPVPSTHGQIAPISLFSFPPRD